MMISKFVGFKLIINLGRIVVFGPVFFKKMKNLFILTVCIGFLVSCDGHKSDITMEVYRQEGGYGYKIIQKNRLLINQSIIPSVQGNRKFCDSIDAVKIGNEVIKMIKKHKTPVITTNDLQRLKIKLKC